MEVIGAGEATITASQESGDNYEAASESVTITIAKAGKPIAKLVPIEVTVVESDSKRLGLGAGYSSNTGFRTEATYQYNNLFDRAYSLVTGARIEQKRQW